MVFFFSGWNVLSCHLSCPPPYCTNCHIMWPTYLHTCHMMTTEVSPWQHPLGGNGDVVLSSAEVCRGSTNDDPTCQTLPETFVREVEICGPLFRGQRRWHIYLVTLDRSDKYPFEFGRGTGGLVPALWWDTGAPRARSSSFIDLSRASLRITSCVALLLRT